LIGAAAGYSAVAIIQALSRLFKRLWENLVAIAKNIWGYVSEATQYYFGLVAQFLDQNWSEIQSWLNQELGYARTWLVALLKEGKEAFLVFVNPQETQEKSGVISLGVVKDSNVQLPSLQNPIVTELVI